MSQDCRNDCVPPLRFPRRPGSISAACPADDFCCADNTRADVGNRPGLGHFNYRIGTYGSIREWLLHRLNQQDALREWTHRGADDPGIALLEGAAMLGDILTFYQELYANEAFLRTANGHGGIADLVRLTGYRPAAGLGGNAVFAFAAKGTQPLSIPLRFPLKAQLANQSKPSEFETKEAITAYPWLSRFKLYRPLQTPHITAKTTEFYISTPSPYAAAPVKFKSGDRLLIGESGAADSLSGAEIVLVDSVRELFGTQLVTIQGKLKRTADALSLSAFKLGRTFHHFGYNAPPTLIKTPNPIESTTTTASGKTTVTTNVTETHISFLRSLNGSTAADGSGLIVSPALGASEIPLEAGVRDLPHGISLALQGEFTDGSPFTFVRSLAGLRPVSQTWGALTAAVSLATLNQPLATTSKNADIRGLQIHEVLGSPLTLNAGYTDTPANTGHELAFYGTREEAESLRGRRLLLEQAGRETRLISVSGVQPVTSYPTMPQLHRITLAATVEYVDYPAVGASPVTVYGNLADADEGKSLPPAPLGNGNNTLAFQTFELPKSPLTYHLAPENTPPTTPELEIYVNDRRWQRVESFFGRKGGEEIYLVREDTESKSWVQFGDGKTGAKLPTGINNIVAVQRVGNGAFGPLEEGVTPQAGAKLNGLDKVYLPGVVTGGIAPEAADCTRRSAPGRLQSLGRLVSVQDFQSEALALPGVAKVSAVWQLYGNAPAVVVTVLMETGRGGELAAVRATLAQYNRTRGAQRFPVIVIEGRRLWINLSVQYALDPAFQAALVEPEIRAALGVSRGLPISQETQTGLFSLPRRDFGAHEYATTCAGVVNQIEGVVWAKVTAFNSLKDTDTPASIAPATLPATFNDVVSCGDMTHLLALYQTHLSLTQVAETGGAA